MTQPTSPNLDPNEADLQYADIAIAAEERRFARMEGSRITKEQFIAEINSEGIDCDETHVSPIGVASASWICRLPKCEIAYNNLDRDTFQSPFWLYKGIEGSTLSDAIKAHIAMWGVR
jgi:hypothetical protein